MREDNKNTKMLKNELWKGKMSIEAMFRGNQIIEEIHYSKKSRRTI